MTLLEFKVYVSLRFGIRDAKRELGKLYECGLDCTSDCMSQHLEIMLATCARNVRHVTNLFKADSLDKTTLSASV